MLYNEYNDNNQYAIKIMSIAIVFLEIFIFPKINGTYSQKRGLIAMVDFKQIAISFIGAICPRSVRHLCATLGSYTTYMVSISNGSRYGADQELGALYIQRAVSRSHNRYSSIRCNCSIGII